MLYRVESSPLKRCNPVAEERYYHRGIPVMYFQQHDDDELQLITFIIIKVTTFERSYEITGQAVIRYVFVISSCLFILFDHLLCLMH